MEISCIIIDDELHAIAELVDLIEKTPGIYLLNSFENIQAAVTYLADNKTVDIIFSDIEMNDIDGISAAKILHRYCDYLIYVTAHRNFALDAFGVNAAGFLVKPVSHQDLINQVAIIADKIKKSASSSKDIIFIKGSSKNTFIKLDVKSIICVSALLNYVNIHTCKGAEVTYIGLKAVAELLKKQDHFFRISKSVIINLNYVERVDGNLVRLINNNIFTIGEKYRSAFHDFLRKRTLNF
ncbi:MAG: response regulator transcription factor [Sphingobacteriales bacterium]|nr:response regulator transcription factor [Sphingobacteriales bacterium]OJV98777.1 MAG: hypothetical protein BGO52_08365 [Sphingobacteriales bacterium 44-61]